MQPLMCTHPLGSHTLALFRSHCGDLFEELLKDLLQDPRSRSRWDRLQELSYRRYLFDDLLGEPLEDLLREPQIKNPMRTGPSLVGVVQRSLEGCAQP